MKTVGVIGIGDMGSGLAKNLLNAGFTVRGRDLLAHRMEAFTQMGGEALATVAEVGQGAEERRPSNTGSNLRGSSQR